MGVGMRERRERSDEYAASVILQDYIDEQKRPPLADSPLYETN
jgi:RNase H-fold protein (predicted Holliday junction resolvase)